MKMLPRACFTQFPLLLYQGDGYKRTLPKWFRQHLHQ